MKIKHILKSVEFAEILKNGLKANGRKMALYVLDKRSTEEPAVGIIISKKMVPNAVRRNYIRRRIYAFFSDEGRCLKRGRDTVIRVSASLKAEKKKALAQLIREELGALVDKAGIEK